MKRTPSSSTVQSPVCVAQCRARIVDDAAPLHFVGHWDGRGRAKLANNGQSAVLTFSDRPFRPFVVGGPLTGVYLFEQLHFHWGPDDTVGCEHLFDGRAHSMEAHLVHYNVRYGSFTRALAKPDGLAVVALLLDAQATSGADWEPLQPIVRALRYIRQPDSSEITLPADCLRWMSGLELGRHYYTYHGSMTTAPYRESVTWLIYRTPIFISSRQTAAFRRLLRRSKPGKDTLITSNFRPVQRSTAGGDAFRLVFVRDSVPTVRAKL
uniref:Alpha-carbonic anhydrase domain-containing protein n=1 Tax=Anopheles epiroticus TaxID=199890 RepID=A0A182PT48_9DIPT